jgi:hypothetical protein
MVADSWIAPDVARATTMAILFENYSVPALSVANQVLPPFAKPFAHPLPSVSQRTCRQQVLAAVGAGRPTALVVDIGNDDTHIIPVVQGTAYFLGRPLAGMCWCDDYNRASSFSLTLSSAGEVHGNGAVQLPGLGGANLTKYLATLLKKKAPTTLDLDNHDSLAAGSPSLVCLTHGEDVKPTPPVWLVRHKARAGLLFDESGTRSSAGRHAPGLAALLQFNSPEWDLPRPSARRAPGRGPSLGPPP